MRLVLTISIAGLVACGCSEAFAQSACRGASTRIAWVGDSITTGLTGTAAEKAPAKLQSLLGYGYFVRQFAAAGFSVSSIRSTWTNSVDGQGYHVLIHEGGVNDLNSGTAAATIFTTIETTLDEAKADGMTVIPINVLPWGGYSGSTAGKQTATTTLNTSIAGWCTANGAECVDAHGEMGDSGTPANLDATYDYGDGLHLNVAGNAALAALVRAAVQ